MKIHRRVVWLHFLVFLYLLAVLFSWRGLDVYSQKNIHDSDCSCSDCCSSISELRTEFMLGDRLLNGTEKKFDLPTPLDILNHEYFSDYRRPIPATRKVLPRGRGKPKNVTKPPVCVFSYVMPQKTVEAQPEVQQDVQV